VLIDQLLSDLELTMQPFAVCEVASGWRLHLDKVDWVTVHFVVFGNGRLRAGTQGTLRPMALTRHSLALVPPSQVHQIELGDPVEHDAAPRTPRRRADELTAFEAGPSQDVELRIVCGRLRAKSSRGLGLFDHLRSPLVIDFADTPAMVHVFERLLEEERHPATASSVMISALMSEALILLFRRLRSDPEWPLPWLAALEDPRLAHAINLMLEHPEQDHSVESLAEATSMSRTAFAEAFRAHYGQGPMSYLREHRLRRAGSLLRHTDLTVDEVAARVGYASRSQFSRAFSGRFGVTPTAYRSALTV
jgi:AraC family transcriptional activator of mtrCDE